MEARLQKKPKLESNSTANDEDNTEQEEALLALIEHRTKECDRIKEKIEFYTSQLQDAEKKLNDVQAKLGKLRSRSQSGGAVKQEAVAGRTQILIPPINSKNTPGRSVSGGRVSSGSSSGQLDTKRDLDSKPIPGSAEKSRKRILEQKEHQDLVPSIRTCSKPNVLRFQGCTIVSSQHKRKLRSLEICPANDQLFVMSSLDGVVSLWQIQSKGSNASLLSTSDCLSPKQRRWPEDLAWHPEGSSIFAAYTADGGDSQISVLNLNAPPSKRVTFLEQKPHVKGIINSLNFMPWSDICFCTGGSDHAVILWQESDGSWKPKKIQNNVHSSAVMGVAGMYQKKTVLSVGADKRIAAYDLLAGRSDFKHQVEYKCMSVLPNPCDFNLFMVQTGTPSKQLQLYDIRLRKTEIHAFGWKQDASDSQSALINQCWSPDGLYLSSGSADPMIHIFDIRYNTSNPSQSVQAHQKRVFKAAWHQTMPLLISMSSDLNIGLHKMIW